MQILKSLVVLFSSYIMTICPSFILDACNVIYNYQNNLPYKNCDMVISAAMLGISVFFWSFGMIIPKVTMFLNAILATASLYMSI